MNTNPVATGFDIPEDDDAIAASLEDASIPTLMMSMIHMSGDASLLDGQIRPAGAYINEYQGYMTEEDKAAVRAQALEVIRAFRDGGCQLPTPPDRDTIHRMMNFLVAQEVPEEYVPMMLEEMELDGRDHRTDAWGSEVPQQNRQQQGRRNHPCVESRCFHLSESLDIDLSSAAADGGVSISRSHPSTRAGRVTKILRAVLPALRGDTNNPAAPDRAWWSARGSPR